MFNKFKEVVKIAITPLLASLSIMQFADSEHETVKFAVKLIQLYSFRKHNMSVQVSA